MTEVSWLAISIFYGVYVAGLGAVTFAIKDKALKMSRALFFLLFIMNIFLSTMFMYGVTINPDTPENFAPVTLGYFIGNMLAMVAFFWFYGLYLITKVFKKGDKDDE